MTQHHESLHYLLNVTTTVGNSLSLLTQLADRCPPPLSEMALKVASQWSDAQTSRVENLINYVTYERVRRRTGEVTFKSFKELLSPIDRVPFEQYLARYSSLDVCDFSKDALAMHVATVALDIPVYSAIEDLSNLASAESVVTKAVIEHRFSVLEAAICSEPAYRLLRDWDERMQSLAQTAMTDIAKSRKEGSAIEAVVKTLLPDFSFVEQKLVRESLGLARRWNEQLVSLGLPACCEMTEIVDSEPFTRSVLISPPAPSITGMVPCGTADDIKRVLDSNPGCFCLGVVHHQVESTLVLSRKYQRYVHPGQVYVRFSFAAPTPTLDGLHVFPRHLFRVMANIDVPFWFEKFRHPRLVLTESSMSSPVLDQISFYSGLPPEQVWRVHWGRLATDSAKAIEGEVQSIRGIQDVRMQNSHTVFWFVSSTDSPWLDVYPVPWDAAEVLYTMPNPLKWKPVDLSQAMLYTVVDLLQLVAF